MPDSRASESLASRIAAAAPSGEASHHVGFDTSAMRRTRAAPDRVEARGYLLLDDGAYELVAAFAPLDVFWQMKAMEVAATTRQESRRRAGGAGAGAEGLARPSLVGSVWVVEGVLKPGAQEDRPGAGRIARMLHVSRLHGLDRVALERRGPRLLERIDVTAMLPAVARDA